MAERNLGKKTYTLLDLAESIQRMFSEHYKQRYWVKAEMNKLNHYTQSCHCYPELLQKERGTTVVEFKSILWKNDYERINRLFTSQIGEPLKDGIKVLCDVSVSYSPQYGLSLRIHDIDISYTLGDIEAEKKETIERLKSEGAFTLNKKKMHALLPKRIAVISVESSKGFADFQDIIDARRDRFSIFRMLFPALLQGDKAVESLLAALKRAAQVAHRFDAVAIIRGGGGDVGLSCFNNFALAHAIATFPIPVYTGIGHATNETVCEMVSYYNGITPSKVAQHLLEQFEAFEANVIQSQHTVTRFARETLAVQTRELHIHSRIIRQTASGILTHHHHRLRSNSEQLQKLSKRFLEGNFKHLQSSAERITVGSTHQLKSSAERVQQSTRQLDTASASALSIKRTSLEHIEHIVSLSDPKKILQRGYSITTINGKSLRDTTQLMPGDRVSTTLLHGIFESQVTQLIHQQ